MEGTFMRMASLAAVSAAAVAVAIAGSGAAHADDYIDFGTNQAACKSAARQANATGSGYSYCYQTGPGHYSLYLDS
jgi:hypothetical protein